jgi:hypothetical protein
MVEIEFDASPRVSNDEPKKRSAPPESNNADFRGGMQPVQKPAAKAKNPGEVKVRTMA